MTKNSEIREKKAEDNTWSMRIRIGYIFSCCVILLITGVAKLISVTGEAGLLDEADPIFNLPFKHLLLAVGILEIGIVAFCIFGKIQERMVNVILWLAVMFSAYRFSLWALGWEKPCHCLGNLTSRLNIPEALANQILVSSLAYMLLAGVVVKALHRISDNSKGVRVGV